MKIAKLSILSIIALGSLLAFGPLAQAEDAQPKAKQGTKEGQKAKAGDQLTQLTTKLELSQTQQDKLKPILRERAGKAKELRAKTDLSREDRTKKMQELNADYDKKIKAVLTPDQVKKYDDWIKENRARGQGGQKQKKQKTA